MWKFGSKLAPDVQDECKRRYIYRMTEGSIKTKTNPCASKMMETYKLRILTDEEWLATTKFKVKADGTLDNREKWCESHHPDYKAK